MKKMLLILLIAAGMTAALAVVTSWCLVAPGEVVVVRRLGRRVDPPWGPGLHWRFPLGIDRIDRVRADAVRQVTIGLAAPAAADLEPSAGEVMTGDLNLLRFQATVQYRVARPIDNVLLVDQVEPLLATSAEASVSRALAVRGVDAVLRSDRQAIAREVERDLQRAADRYESGISILRGVSLTDARPPNEVEADFAAGQSAESERDRRVNEAKGYDETTTTAARTRPPETKLRNRTRVDRPPDCPIRECRRAAIPSPLGRSRAIAFLDHASALYRDDSVALGRREKQGRSAGRRRYRLDCPGGQRTSAKLRTETIAAEPSRGFGKVKRTSEMVGGRDLP